MFSNMAAPFSIPISNSLPFLEHVRHIPPLFPMSLLRLSLVDFVKIVTHLHPSHSLPPFLCLLSFLTSYMLFKLFKVIFKLLNF